MPIAWADITDAAVAEYSPISAKLITRLRNRDQLNRQQSLVGTGANYSTGAGPTSFTTIGTFRIYVPDCYIGPSGTRLELYADIDINDAGVASATFRLEVGGTVSQTQTVNTTGGAVTENDQLFTLDWTPTGDAIASINVQVDTTGAPTTAGWQWPNTDTDAFLGNLPRSGE